LAVLGKVFFTLGFVIGGINYLLTAGYFFSNDNALLGLIQLLVPPAEVIMPWVANTTLGIMSVLSLGLCLVGAVLMEKKILDGLNQGRIKRTHKQCGCVSSKSKLSAIEVLSAKDP